MRKKISALFLLIFMIIVSIFPNVAFADTNVTVKLPNFKVTLNETEVNNSYRQYPLITYKGITYFPMTFYDCRYLGLETTWDNVNGLGISKMNVSAPYNASLQKNKNSNNMTARIPRFNITLNNRIIDNSKEEYPILLFRNITYFPMTWKFCVEEFGWKYNFDIKGGLVIESSNPVVEKISLVNCRGNFTATEKYYVYQGKDGLIYRAPKNNINDFSLANTELGIPETYPLFYKSNGELMMSHRYGTASIGGVMYHTINDDGTLSEPEYVRDTLVRYGDLTVTVNYGSVGPVFYTLCVYDGKAWGNLIRLYSGDGDYALANIGRDFTIVGRDIYFSAAYGTYVESSGYNYVKEGLFKLDIDTCEEVQLVDKYVQSFSIEGQNIYFMQNDMLYKTDLNSANGFVNLLEGKQISDYMVIGDNIFYVEKNGDLLYKNSDEKPLFENKKIFNMLGVGLQKIDYYAVITFVKDNFDPHGFAIFDKTGLLVFKSEDDVEFKSMNNDTAYFCSTVNNELYSVKLK